MCLKIRNICIYIRTYTYVHTYIYNTYIHIIYKLEGEKSIIHNSPEIYLVLHVYNHELTTIIFSTW